MYLEEIEQLKRELAALAECLKSETNRLARELIFERSCEIFERIKRALRE